MNRISSSRIIKNSIWVMSGSATRAFMSAFTSVFLARLLTQDDFGNLQFVVSINFILQSFGSFAYPNVVKKKLIHLIGKERDILDEAQGIILLTYFPIVCVFFILFLLSFKIHSFNQRVLLMLFVSSIGFLFSSSAPIGAWLDSKLYSKKSAMVLSVSLIVSNLAKIFFVLTGFSLLWQSFAISLQYITQWILYGFYKRKIVTSPQNHTKVLVGISRESFPFFWTVLFLNILYKADQVILGIISTPKILSEYSAASKLSEPWSNFIIAIIVSVFPQIIEKSKESKEAMIDCFQRSLRWITWLSLAICFFVSIFSTQLIKLVFGETYCSSIGLLRGHVWANIFMVWFYAQNVLEVELGLGKQLLIKSFIAATINIVLNFILVPVYGAYGAVVSTVIGYAFLGAIGNLFFKKTRFLFFLLLKSLFPGPIRFR